MPSSVHGAPPLADDRVHLWPVRLARDPRILERLLATLAPDERDRAGRYHYDLHRDRYIAARGTLRRILAGYLGMAPESVTLTYGPSGKPALASRAARHAVTFNVSHSGEWALYAVAAGRAVGVDVECLRSVPHIAELARATCSPGERRALEQAEPEHRDAMFFGYWTCKEAYLKARGDGLAREPAQVEVTLEPPRLARVPDDDEAARWKLERLSPAPGYVAALVAEGNAWSPMTIAGIAEPDARP